MPNVIPSRGGIAIKNIRNLFYTQAAKYFNNTSYVVIGFAILYYALVILLPVNKAVIARYHLSSHEYHVLLFIVELPLTFVWFASFYGYHKLKLYTAAISKTREAEVFRRLTLGCYWLAWSFLLPSLVSLILGAIASQHEAFYATSLIFDNYFNLLFPLVAFSIIADGAHRLFYQGRAKTSALSIRGLLFLFILIGTFYCYLTFRQLDLANLTSTNNPYYLPVWLVIVSLIIPYLYTWLIGLLAAYEFGLFATQVKGVIYRRALQFVSMGVVLVIVASIGVQYLHSVIPRTGRLSLNSILVATCLIYVIIIIGFVLISNGANHLKRIEDI